MSAYATRLSSSGRRSSRRLARPGSAWRWLAELPTSCPFIGRCLKFAIQATFRLEAPPSPIHIAYCRCALEKRTRNGSTQQDPPSVDPKTDWLVQIHDRRFVSVVYRPAEKPVVFGDLREEGTKFVAWVPHYAKSQFVRSVVAQLAMEWAPAGDRYPDVVSEWEEPTKDARELRSLGYEYETLGADDPLRRAAQATVRNPLFTTTINISLAIRRAIRRYLDIEQLRPASATEVAAERHMRRPAKRRRRSSK